MVSLLLIIFLSAIPASAHGYIVRSIPENRAVLERAPARLQVWFSESLEADFSSITVRDQAGNTIATGGVSGENASLLQARLPTNLPDGAYVAELRVAFASDGHVVTETRLFFVGQAVSGVEGTAATTQANPLEVVWRTLTLSATLLLFGTFALYSLVLLPAWGNPAYPAGGLPPRLMRRLSAVIALALLAAFVGNALAIWQQAMTLFNADLGQVIAQNWWGVVRVSTRFGDLWNARVLLLALVAGLYGLSLYFREEQPVLVRPMWTASAWGMALALGTFGAGSHAAGSLLWPWLGVAADWIHTLAVGLWAGGLGALALTLPVALQPYTGETRRAALVAALKRFSRLAVACVVLVIVTGVYSSLTWINRPADVTQTPFGNTLALKLLLVAGLLVVGLAHQIALHPERWRRTSPPNPLSINGEGEKNGATFVERILWQVQKFIPTLRLEALLALLVVGAAGWLSASPVPVPPDVQAAVLPLTSIQTVGDYDVSVTITPGGPGVNTYDVAVTQNGQPVDNTVVRWQVVNPARDWRGAWEFAESAGNGLYVAAGNEIDRPGDWWTLVDITNTNGNTQRAAFAWTVTPEAAVPESREPTVFNVLALLGLLLALGWLAATPARRLYRRLDLNAANVTVAVGAVAATVLFSIVGGVILQNSQAQYEATVNPPPQIINSVLPDAASLERGRVLLTTACADWEGDTFNRLIERLPRTRDEELFAAVQSGWRGLPACAADLTDAQRWDVVNALRTLG